MKIKTEGREVFVRNKRRFTGKAVGFKVDIVRLMNGKKAQREYLDHPGAVAIIAVVKPGHIVMVRQYRYPVATMTWEIPAGKLDRGEKPELCVQRELEEETGYRPGRIRKLLTFWPTASFANEVIHIYVAENLKSGRANPDEDEFLSAKIWPLKKIYADIKRGKIKDAKTLIALLAYRFNRS